MVRKKRSRPGEKPKCDCGVATGDRTDHEAECAAAYLHKPTPPADENPFGATPGEDAAVWVAIDDLVEWPDNPRHNEAAIGEVARLIERFGFGAPLTARLANREIIAGHTRWRAAKKLGMTRLPVRFLDLSAADAHLLALADNKSHEIATWDDEKLAAVIGHLREAGSDVAEAGFTRDDLDRIAKVTAGIDAQPTTEPPPRLDEKKKIVCPQCNHEFTP